MKLIKNNSGILRPATPPLTTWSHKTLMWDSTKGAQGGCGHSDHVQCAQIIRNVYEALL